MTKPNSIIWGLERIAEAVDLNSTTVGSRAIDFEGIFTFRDRRRRWYLPSENAEPMKVAIASNRPIKRAQGGRTAFGKVDRRKEDGQFVKRVTIVGGGTNYKK